MNFSAVLSAIGGTFFAPLSAGTLPAAPRISGHRHKPVTFMILEDYDKGGDLTNLALDFQLMNKLGIDQMRCSFGWDDFEPSRGPYDFAWLQQFVALAAQYGIKLCPYVGYTAPWASVHGSDGIYWNDPPAYEQDWYDFVFKLASILQAYPNVVSYEFCNEENDASWWEGGITRYGRTLRQAALAVQAANPQAEVILGGFVFPDYDFLVGLDDKGYAPYWGITPFHAYPETWEEQFEGISF